MLDTQNLAHRGARAGAHRAFGNRIGRGGGCGGFAHRQIGVGVRLA